MFCTNCGAPVNDDAKFCTKCGASLTEQAEIKEEIKIETTPVDNTLSDDFDITKPQAPINVPVNNVQIPNEPTYNFDTPKKSKPANKNLIIIISAVVALLIAIGGIFAYLHFAKNDGNTTNPSGQTNPGNTVDPEIKKPKITPIDDDVIESIIDRYSEYTEVGVYVKNLKTGYEYGHDEYDSLLASAMSQVVILNAVSDTLKDYDLDSDTEEIYFNYIPNGKEAPSSKNDDGTYISISDCVKDVAIYGDNNKSNQLVDYIADVNGVSNGFSLINRMLSNEDLLNTRINRKIYTDSKLIDYNADPNTTCAKEIAKIFENLIKNSKFGSEAYMKNIFKSISLKGESIGLKKYIPEEYDICSANAMNSQCSNDVAIISMGDTEVLVAILCCTDEDRTDIETYEDREKIQKKIIEHIIETQFKTEDEDEVEQAEEWNDLVVDDTKKEPAKKKDDKFELGGGFKGKIVFD